MVKSVVREHHWPPSQVEALFFDRDDYFGLLYWYDDVVEVNKEIEAKTKKPGKGMPIG